jgi:HEAT repeat protein
MNQRRVLTVEALLFLSFTLVLLLAFPARPEIPDSPKNRVLDPADRYQKARLGSRVEEWVRHLDDKDPEVRFEAVKLLGESGDPEANQYIIEAVENADARVAIAAVDYLGRIKAKDAVSFLSERLFLTGANATLRQHILVALGRIGDEGSSQRVLDFIQGETDPSLRSTAIRVLGEIGTQPIGAELQKLSEQEADSKQRTLMHDAVAKITARATDSLAHRTTSPTK